MADHHAGVDLDRIILRVNSRHSYHAVYSDYFLGYLPAIGDRRDDWRFYCGSRTRVASGKQYVQKQTTIIFGQPRGTVQGSRTIDTTL